jgi:hypothetical protein
MTNLTLDSLPRPKYGSGQADLNVNTINRNYLNSAKDSMPIVVLGYRLNDFAGT